MKKNIEINIPYGWDIDIEKLENCITSNNTNLLIPLKKVELKYPKIISFREVGSNNLFILTDNGYKDYACMNTYYNLDDMLYTGSSLKDGFVEIYQVAQSENEIFTLGDNVKNVDNKFFKITEFIINNKYGIVAKDDKNSEYVEYLKRIELSIFTTEDSVEIYNDNQHIYGICTKANWQTAEYKISHVLRSRNNEYSSSFNSDVWKYFSTQEARDKYRDNNIPKYSKKEVLDAMIYSKHKNNGQNSTIISEIKLKEKLGL